MKIIKQISKHFSNPFSTHTVIKKEITITVNGKDIDPDSEEGKALQKETDESFSKIAEGFKLMDEAFKKF